MERSAPDLEKMKAKTKKLRDAAQTLLKEAGRPANEIAGSTSLETLTEALATAVKKCPNDDLQFLMIVRSVLTGCNLMLRTGNRMEGCVKDLYGTHGRN